MPTFPTRSFMVPLAMSQKFNELDCMSREKPSSPYWLFNLFITGRMGVVALDTMVRIAIDNLQIGEFYLPCTAESVLGQAIHKVWLNGLNEHPDEIGRAINFKWIFFDSMAVEQAIDDMKQFDDPSTRVMVPLTIIVA